MRVTDPIGGPPNLDRYFHDYQKHFREITHYSLHLRYLTAAYSRGDDADQLRQIYRLVIGKVTAMQAAGQPIVFIHHRKYAQPFRDLLVLLSFSLCLRADRAEVSTLLNSSERGDPLIETLAAAVSPELAQASSEPVFYSHFDGLYDALRETGPPRERSLAHYLDVWYLDKMEGFPFKDAHLWSDPGDYVGYWCFEAAGVVAALGIDDQTFAAHPHYPRDLAAFYLRG